MREAAKGRSRWLGAVAGGVIGAVALLGQATPAVARQVDAPTDQPADPTAAADPRSPAPGVSDADGQQLDADGKTARGVKTFADTPDAPAAGRDGAKVKAGAKAKDDGKARPEVDVGGLVQLRGVAAPPWQGGTDGEGDAETERWRASFLVPRARIDIGTKVAGWKVRTKVAFEKAEVRLLNAYGERKLGDLLTVTIGQFKRLFSQDYLVSADALQVFERSDVVKLAGASRDQGLLLTSEAWAERIRAAIGVWNGNGIGVRLNDSAFFRYEARLDVMPLGAYDLVSHPIGAPALLRLGAGGALSRDVDSRKNKSGRLTEYADLQGVSGFAAFKASGVELRAEYFHLLTDPVDARPEDQRGTPLPVAGTTGRGGYVQLAFDVPRTKALQLVAAGEQWAAEDRDAPADALGLASGQRALTVAANWYWKGDRCKLQAAWQTRQVDDDNDADAEDATRWLANLQLQLMY